MDGRRGDWIATFSGGRFWPLDPRPEDVRIEDVAHALSCIGRFGGHARSFYSVAQHSVLVARCCDPADALWGLLHDASEAYLADVPRPVKRLPAMDAYRAAEAAVMGVVCERFGLDPAEPASVRRADLAVLKAEGMQLMAGGIHTWTVPGGDVAAPDGLVIEPWGPAVAEREFLAGFDRLMTDREVVADVA